jgi:hypothetical protein
LKIFKDRDTLNAAAHEIGVKSGGLSARDIQRHHFKDLVDAFSNEVNVRELCLTCTYGVRRAYLKRKHNRKDIKARMEANLPEYATNEFCNAFMHGWAKGWSEAMSKAKEACDER